MRLEWTLGRLATPADAALRALLPPAVEAAAGGGNLPRVRVHSELGARGADVASLTRIPASRGRAVGGGVVVPSEAMRSGIVAMAPALAEQTVVIPFPAPEAIYVWDDTRPVVEVTERFHLEERPRILAVADWEQGQGLSRLLPLARSALGAGGELVLLGAAPHRPRIAPLLAHLRLAETVVLLPEPTAREAAGLLHSADLLVQADASAAYPYWLRWAAAAGLPAVAQDSETARDASGHAALMVRADREDAWGPAVDRALTDLRLRETMIGRGRLAAEPSHLTHVAALWAEWLLARSRTGRRVFLAR